MIPSQPTSSVSWSSTAAPVAASVPAVVAVAPSAPAARDTQASLQQGPGRQPPQASARAPAVDTAPGDPVRQATELALKREAEAQLRAQELERARLRQEAQRDTVEQLRQTLRQVWDASATVVEQALQREADAARAPEAASAARSKSLDAYEGPAVARDPAGSHVNRRV
ncbi:MULTISPECIES: hypothetical protein [unclassified Hydrogenophaga]|uniref:hypothetical protein n=1 Tax=unclassified Hydrogenophaga TaxID=2610897 RepID=UPI000AFE4AC9|nr:MULTISPECIES: hypothetical protein [unclassified Hydrogenophaga]MBN9373420.1 hypothetical protein [Hydrogenophaga sp.]